MKEISVALVHTLRCNELAACLASFLVYYDENLVHKYVQLKYVLGVQFISNLVAGPAVANGDEETNQALTEIDNSVLMKGRPV